MISSDYGGWEANINSFNISNSNVNTELKFMFLLNEDLVFSLWIDKEIYSRNADTLNEIGVGIGLTYKPIF